MDFSDHETGQGWLLLVYRIPREPTRLRASVWRKLKAAGAVYLQNSVAVLPDSPVHERSLRSLRKHIEELGGSAQLMRCDVLAGNPDVVAAYNAARDEEYEEIIDRCRGFLAEIEKETAAEKFTYAELEENDEDLTKLRRWFEKVQLRDSLDAARGAEAKAALQDCVAPWTSSPTRSTWPKTAPESTRSVATARSVSDAHAPSPANSALRNSRCVERPHHHGCRPGRTKPLPTGRARPDAGHSQAPD
ncbi:Chromate resistance protein ChrB [Saccharomonospora sp. CUA-673]|uniref:Chromate resistance protein ChrB n=1 Tax=Saccharomonospora sp. CUA-673 TaxID=1904969 RepID=UPI001C9E6F5E|nr:Chromate resistance protein ChrB [Saccharomonospora sp. CUA-673]